VCSVKIYSELNLLNLLFNLKSGYRKWHTVCMRLSYYRRIELHQLEGKHWDRVFLTTKLMIFFC